jgi:hypothetical protein
VTEASTVEDPKLGDTRASGVGGQPPAAVAASSVFYGGEEGTSPEGDLLAAPATGAAADALEGATLCTEASLSPTGSVTPPRPLRP